METRAMHPCRVCYTYVEHGVYVFSEQAKLLCLQAKIRKYLYVTVSMDDRLPLNVCNNCCKQIEGIHKFAMMASRNQEKFDKLIKDNCSPADNNISETKGLLHSYLTKRSMDKIEQDTEEVEVRVDPMLFLQYNSDGDLSDNNEEEEEDEHQLELIPVSQANAHREELTAMYECPMCLKTFQAEYAMHTHIWSHASRNTRIILNNHNIYTMGGNSMDLHEELEHNNNNIDDSGGIGETETDGGFTCPICNKIISTKGNLKVHLETHRPKGKYGCDICGRVFKTQCNLRRHKEYHSGVQFTCNVCGRVYPTNSTLRAHSITHSDLRPHKCPLCDKTFKRNQDLKFHINQHTGARPYKCPYCPKAFASSGNCFSHRKRMHPLEVERDREKAAKIMRYPSTAKTASAQS